jgi:tRNA 2-thiouridine synthesizing protein A
MLVLGRHDSVGAMAEEIKIVDARGLVCPLPVLRARKALQGVAKGAAIEVLATDPAALKDFPAFCAESGHALEAQSAADGVYRFVIRRAP